jgi:nucleotide-binding universal stress UspA family protein
MSLDIKILGLGTSRHQFLKSLLADDLQNHGIDHTITDVTNIDEIINYQVESIPSVIVNNTKIFQANEYANIWMMEDSVKTFILREITSKGKHTILLPTDFSPTAINAYHYAQKLAPHLDLEIEVIHVYRPVAEMTHTVAAGVDYRTVLEESLTHFATDHRIPQNGATAGVQTSFLEGPPAHEIIEKSKAPNVSLLLMGATGENGFLEKVFGSVSVQVSLGSHCPVLLVPHHVNFKPIKNILYATNDHSLQSRPVKLAIQMGAVFEAMIHFLHIESGQNNYPSWKLCELLGKVDAKIPTNHLQIKADSVKDGIDNYIRKNEIDLVVMATRKRNFWEKIMSKSVTREIVMEPKTAILVFHDDDPKN